MLIKAIIDYFIHKYERKLYWKAVKELDYRTERMNTINMVEKK